MLGLLLIYFVGKKFYELAESFDKNKWGIAILGVVFYYLGTFLVGILIGISASFGYFSNLLEASTLVLSIIALPFGLLTAWGLYAFLDNSWSNNTKESNFDLLDDELYK